MKSRFRWPLTASVLIIAVAFGIWAAFFRGPSEKCKPVIDILEFNHAQAARVSEQPADPNNPVPTQAEDLIYQQWADGLAEQAQKVSDPDCRCRRFQLAQLASEFAAGLPGAGRGAAPCAGGAATARSIGDVRAQPAHRRPAAAAIPGLQILTG